MEEKFEMNELFELSMKINAFNSNPRTGAFICYIAKCPLQKPIFALFLKIMIDLEDLQLPNNYLFFNKDKKCSFPSIRNKNTGEIIPILKMQ